MYIIKAVKNREKSSSIFLDIAKAFEMVNHDIILKNLKYYGICGLSVNLFKFYLVGRYQYVKINNAKSNNKAIVCGVPQRSVLGLLFFLIYINDTYKSGPKVYFHLFADDTCLFYSKKSYKKKKKKWKLRLIFLLS